MKYELGDLVAHNHEDVDSLGVICGFTEDGGVEVFFFKWKNIRKRRHGPFWANEEDIRERPFMPYYYDCLHSDKVCPGGTRLRIIQKVEK